MIHEHISIKNNVVDLSNIPDSPKDLKVHLTFNPITLVIVLYSKCFRFIPEENTFCVYVSFLCYVCMCVASGTLRRAGSLLQREYVQKFWRFGNSCQRSR